MNMQKGFEKILNTLVVPTDDKLTGAKVDKFMTIPHTYHVTYFLKDGEEIPYTSKSYERLEKLTNNMFKMLGPSSKDKFIIGFK